MYAVFISPLPLHDGTEQKVVFDTLDEAEQYTCPSGYKQSPVYRWVDVMFAWYEV